MRIITRILALLGLLGAPFLLQTAQAHSGGKLHDPNIIHMAMTAAFVSENGTPIYEEIAQYISHKTGLKTEMISGLPYDTVDQMIQEGVIQVAFVCGYPYVLTKDKHPDALKLLAAPVMENKRYGDKPVYFSYIIAQKDSPISSFKDLKGKRFVFNESLSNSGYNMPRAKLISLGETHGFFGSVVRSGSHEESIRMVSEGKADASAVDSLVFDYALATKQPYTKNVKIVETLGPASIPPVVYSKSLSPEIANKLQDTLVNMAYDPEGKAILEKVYLKGFIKVDDSQYNDIRAMHEMAKKNHYMTLQ